MHVTAEGIKSSCTRDARDRRRSQVKLRARCMHMHVTTVQRAYRQVTLQTLKRNYRNYEWKFVTIIFNLRVFAQ